MMHLKIDSTKYRNRFDLRKKKKNGRSEFSIISFSIEYIATDWADIKEGDFIQTEI